jgi:hypothetical protein
LVPLGLVPATNVEKLMHNWLLTPNSVDRNIRMVGMEFGYLDNLESKKYSLLQNIMLTNDPTAIMFPICSTIAFGPS